MNIKPCPFCGVTPVYSKDSISDIYSAAAGGFELRHACFENVRGFEIAARKIIVRGETRQECVDKWNRRTDEK